MFDQDKLKEKIAEFIKKPVSFLKEETVLTDLVAESFALIEMLIELQEEFEVRFFVQEDLRSIKTLGDLIRLFESHAIAAP
jgi:acyl carrier protein